MFDEGCSSNSKTPREVWVRLFGLLVFLGGKKLEKVGRRLWGFYCYRHMYQGFFKASMGLPPCSCGWREISACVGHQDGGEELEDPALVGTSTCFHNPVGEGSSDFQ